MRKLAAGIWRTSWQPRWKPVLRPIIGIAVRGREHGALRRHPGLHVGYRPAKLPRPGLRHTGLQRLFFRIYTHTGNCRTEYRFAPRIAQSQPKNRRPASYSLGLFLGRSEEHTSELQSLMRISYAVFC